MRAVDLSRFFCDERSCPPVIGGALVYKDVESHLTDVYAATLAPFLRREVDALMARLALAAAGVRYSCSLADRRDSSPCWWPRPSRCGVPRRPRAAGGPVLVVGDSLAVGMRPFLVPMLGDREVAWDARTGRTTPQGLQVLRACAGEVKPATVVVSLGTNDGSDRGRFADRIRRILGALPPRTCVVWPSIIRPPRKGPYDGLDRVLRRQAQRDPASSCRAGTTRCCAARCGCPTASTPTSSASSTAAG